MNEAMERVSRSRTCSLPVEVMDASGATAASVRIERTWRLTRSSACFFSSAVIEDGFFVAAANVEESALASLFLKEETAAAARARIGAAGGEGGAGVEVEEEEVEADDDESGMAPAAADANDDDATAISLLATAAGALFGAETTRDAFNRAQTVGRTAAFVGAREF